MTEKLSEWIKDKEDAIYGGVFETLTEKVKVLQSERDHLQDRLTDEIAVVDDLKTERDALKERLADVYAKWGIATKDRVQFENTLTDKLEVAEAEVERLTKRMRESEEERITAKAEVKNLENEAIELHNIIVEQRTRLAEAQKLINEVDCGMTIADSESDTCAGCDNWQGEGESCWFARVKEALK